jgi:hypothetical protein
VIRSPRQDLATRPIPPCQSVVPSLVRKASALLAESPVKIRPVAVAGRSARAGSLPPAGRTSGRHQTPPRCSPATNDLPWGERPAQRRGRSTLCHGCALRRLQNWPPVAGIPPLDGNNLSPKRIGISNPPRPQARHTPTHPVASADIVRDAHPANSKQSRLRRWRPRPERQLGLAWVRGRALQVREDLREYLLQGRAARADATREQWHRA